MEKGAGLMFLKASDPGTSTMLFAMRYSIFSTSSCKNSLYVACCAEFRGGCFSVHYERSWNVPLQPYLDSIVQYNHDMLVQPYSLLLLGREFSRRCLMRLYREVPT